MLVNLDPNASTQFVESAELTAISKGLRTEYDLDAPNSAHALNEAAEYNLDVVFPSPNQLQLDIDSDHAFAIFDKLQVIVEKYYGITQIEVNPSRSGLPKRHVTITLGRPVTGFERIALQLALGSDKVRELLSVIQEMKGDPHPTLFLEKKTTEV